MKAFLRSVLVGGFVAISWAALDRVIGPVVSIHPSDPGTVFFAASTGAWLVARR